MIKFLQILTFLLVSCGKFEYSPYQVKTEKLDLNAENLDRLTNLSSSNLALAIGSEQDFKVAVIADTHDYYDELKGQIEFINSQNYLLTFVAGDLTNEGLSSEYKIVTDLLRKLRNPFLVAVGNHDLLINGSRIFEDYFGAQDFSLRIHSTAFIVFNNNNWEAQRSVPDLNWLEGELQKYEGYQKVLIAHCPYHDGARFSASEVLEFETLMKRYDVDYFINGHQHTPSEHTRDGVNFKSITVGSSKHKKVLELNIRAGGITHQMRNI